MGLATITPSRLDFDSEVEVARDDDDVDYSGWFCLRTIPFPCPAEGCDFVATHLTAAHLIVVWPSKDDRMLLSHAADARSLGRNPTVEEYEPPLGPCIPYDLWARLGYPVHGKRARPGDKPFRRL